MSSINKTKQFFREFRSEILRVLWVMLGILSAIVFGAAVAQSVSLGIFFGSEKFPFDLGGLLGAGLGVIFAVRISRWERKTADDAVAKREKSEQEKSAVELLVVAFDLKSSFTIIEQVLVAQLYRNIIQTNGDYHEVEMPLTWTDRRTAQHIGEIGEIIENNKGIFPAEIVRKLDMASIVEMRYCEKQLNRGWSLVRDSFTADGQIADKSRDNVLYILDMMADVISSIERAIAAMKPGYSADDFAKSLSAKPLNAFDRLRSLVVADNPDRTAIETALADAYSQR